MSKQPSLGRVALDMWRAQREGAEGLKRRQHERLASLLTYARASSPFYQRRYRDLPTTGVALASLPPVTKPELMSAFDDWMTDRSLSRAELQSFVADPARVGERFRGEYFVCTTSGTTGHPGLFVHDGSAIAVYRALVVRLDLAWLKGSPWWRLLQRGARWGEVVGTGGHFAAAGWLEQERRRGGWRTRGYRLFSVQRPLDELVSRLNAFDPTFVSGYPSALQLLAEEQRAGRLHLHPVFVETAAESSDLATRIHMAESFGCPVYDAYGASEFLILAGGCREGWLHVNADWAILEPVDEHYRPTPPGEPSHTVLLTNLANRVAPVIRYDLSDSVQALPGPCACGNKLPAIRVAGRRDDILRFDAADGRSVTVLPIALVVQADTTAGVLRSQFVQMGPTMLRLRLELEPGVDAEPVWREVRSKLVAWLASQGLANVDLVRATEPPERSAGGAKFRHVLACRH